MNNNNNGEESGRLEEEEEAPPQHPPTQLMYDEERAIKEEGGIYIIPNFSQLVVDQIDSKDDEPPLKKGRWARITDKLWSAVSNGKTFAKSMDDALGEIVVNCLAGTVNKCTICGEDTIRGQSECSAHLDWDKF